MSTEKHASKRPFTYKGETRTLSEWSCRIGVSVRALESRIARGWTPEEVIETPPRNLRSWKNPCIGCPHWKRYSGVEAMGCHYFFDTGQLRSVPEEKCERHKYMMEQYKRDNG